MGYPTTREDAAPKPVPRLGFQAEGTDRKPTVQFSSANVHVRSGEGKEEAVNGEGNLVIGNDPMAGDPKIAAQTGSRRRAGRPGSVERDP